MARSLETIGNSSPSPREIGFRNPNTRPNTSLQAARGQTLSDKIAELIVALKGHIVPRNEMVERQILDEISTILSVFPVRGEFVPARMNIEDAERKLSDRIAWLKDKNDLNAFKEALKDTIGKIEECEEANNLISADRLTRKRKAADALFEQFDVVDGVRKRMSRGIETNRKPEEEDAEEEASQELGTTISSP